MSRIAFENARLINPASVDDWKLVIEDGRIVGHGGGRDQTINLAGKYVAPGFIDIHVHGGGGADFMDLTPEAFRTVCQTHLKHGTTSLTPTSTVATAEDYAKFLALCQSFRDRDTSGARVVGAHHYGPYFFPAARGCHPKLEYRTPGEDEVNAFAGFDRTFPCSITIAPELPRADAMTTHCAERGLIVNVGHSHATFEQVEKAMECGATHVDHLFCAMSDRARLRLSQAFPMRGGVLEATLALPGLTTEVIADGHHLADSLLKTAYLIKGADRLALVTDSMRAVDCPDGEYWFGPEGRGERIRRRGDVGVTLDGAGLASGVMGMDHLVRTMLRATGAPLHEVVRMATLTPARILRLHGVIGSLEVGKRADLLVLSEELQVEQVFIGGVRRL